MSIDGVVLLLLPTILAMPGPLVDRLPTVGVKPARSRTPLVAAEPRTTPVVSGSAAAAPTWSVPFSMLVVPRYILAVESVSFPAPLLNKRVPPANPVSLIAPVPEIV
jgi:hypothetical protein